MDFVIAWLSSCVLFNRAGIPSLCIPQAGQTEAQAMKKSWGADQLLCTFWLPSFLGF